MNILRIEDREFVLLVLATFVWGSGHPIGKLILIELSAPELSFLSSTLAAVAIVLGYKRQKQVHSSI